MKHSGLCFLFVAVLSLPAAAQTPASRLVMQAVDTSKIVALPGSAHPLAQPRYDRGMVNESTPADRLLLLLNRPPEREAAFQQILKDQQTPGSPSYHHWLTAGQIGQQFGPADADVEAVTGWLTSEGFRVARVSKAKRFVEFSGTVGQVNAAFKTRIDEYMVNGELHHANATALTIPMALAGIIGAIAPLDDFSRPQPQVMVRGKGEYDGANRKFKPEFTNPMAWSTPLYALAPADFATQYDLGPMLNAGVTGTGVTIGIINESNIDLSQAAAYRSVFGLAANPVQVIIDGEDPGENSSATEAYLDVEMAGAAAPGAAVYLYISAGSAFQDPLLLAAARAVDDDQADILSVSYGGPEDGDQTWNDLWEQAAAEGQTVLVASGDFGQAQNYYFEQQVNGLASTPWNVAVGGTDFYYADYALGAPSAASD
ncbi:MAG: protease pro-enzyme activation domain-containing protein, partial [Terracidiphilus sp.]